MGVRVGVRGGGELRLRVGLRGGGEVRVRLEVKGWGEGWGREVGVWDEAVKLTLCFPLWISSVSRKSGVP